MQSIAGEDSVVKLDIFHGINRVSRTIKVKKKTAGPKNFLFTRVKKRLFCSELSSCFRQEGDFNGQRMISTPSSEVIHKNINDLLDRWQDKLSEKTVDALLNLRSHSSCLSEIPPSCSSAKNESFHRVLRTFFYGRQQLSLHMFISLLILKVVLHNRQVVGISKPLVPGNFNILAAMTLAPQEFHGIGLAKCMSEGRPFKYDRTITTNIKPIISNSVLLTKLVEAHGIHSKYLNILGAILYSPLSKSESISDEYDSESLRTIGHLGFQIDEKAPCSDFKSAIGSVIDSADLDMLDFSCLRTVEALLTDVANQVGITIFYVVSSKRQALHVVLPKILQSDRVLCIVHMSNGIYVASKVKKSVVETSDANPFKCRCGRKRKKNEVAQFCSVGSKCPCRLLDKACSEQCKCFQCHNGRRKKEVKQRPCRCEQGCIQSRCPCFKNEFSCDENPRCRCKHCENGYGAVPHVASKKSASSCTDSRRRQHSGKLISGNVTDLIDVKSSPWTDFETLLLHQIIRHLRSPADCKIWGVYSLIVEKYPNLQFRAKTLKQVSSKINHMNEYLYMFNK